MFYTEKNIIKLVTKISPILSKEQPIYYPSSYSDYEFDEEALQKNLQRKINLFRQKFELPFLFDWTTSPHQKKKFIRYEALLLTYLLMINTAKGSFLSDLTNGKEPSIEKAKEFYDHLNLFLKDKRFKEDGEWYQYEAELIQATDTADLIKKYGSELKALKAITEDEVNVVENLDDKTIDFYNKPIRDYIELLQKKKELKNELDILNQKIETSLPQDEMNNSCFSVISDDNGVLHSGIFKDLSCEDIIVRIDKIQSYIESAIDKFSE